MPTITQRSISNRRVPHNVRALLLAIGIGEFNATGIIRLMFFSPHQTDPDMPAIIQVTRQIQRELNKMGAGVEVSGAIDQPTDDYLGKLCGSGYLTRPWYQIIEGVISARNRGTQFYQEPTQATQQAVGGVLEDTTVGIGRAVYRLSSGLFGAIAQKEWNNSTMSADGVVRYVADGHDADPNGAYQRAVDEMHESVGKRILGGAAVIAGAIYLFKKRK